MKELLIKIFNTPLTRAVLRDFAKWILHNLIKFLEGLTAKLEGEI